MISTVVQHKSTRSTVIQLNRGMTLVTSHHICLLLTWREELKSLIHLQRMAKLAMQGVYCWILTWKMQVQQTYNAIPKPLYPEVKQYVEDLLNRGWVQKSRSAYSSPVVCVRKKDGTLRLCVDYRKLNQITVPDRHPLPRIQDTLDSLGGNRWFSLLDQGKAYHQGYISPESRHKTAFITP